MCLSIIETYSIEKNRLKFSHLLMVRAKVADRGDGTVGGKDGKGGGGKREGGRMGPER